MTAQETTHKLEDLLSLAVECKLIRMSQLFNPDVQSALEAFAERLEAAPAAPTQEPAGEDRRDALPSLPPCDVVAGALLKLEEADNDYWDSVSMIKYGEACYRAALSASAQAQGETP